MGAIAVKDVVCQRPLILLRGTDPNPDRVVPLAEILREPFLVASASDRSSLNQ